MTPEIKKIIENQGATCLGEGTPVVMHNGSIKKVEDVVCGDLLMGPDSKPRRVISRCEEIKT